MIPRESWAVHVEGGYYDAFVIWESLIIKELLDFENPTYRVLSVKPRDIEFHVKSW